MLEKPIIKKIDKQDGNMPTNIEQLIQKYDLEKLWPYIERIVEYINEKDIKNLDKLLEAITIDDNKNVNINNNLSIKGQEVLNYEVVDSW